MSIPKEYYDLIEEARDDQTVHSMELVNEDEDYVPATEVADVCTNYMDTLRMERAEPEQPVYELQPMPKEEPIVDKYKDTFDGFTMPGLSEEWIAPAKVSVAPTPTYGDVEAWYIHDAETAYQMSGIAEVYMEAREYWRQADRAGLYALVMLVIARTTNDNPQWAAFTIG